MPKYNGVVATVNSSEQFQVPKSVEECKKIRVGKMLSFYHTANSGESIYIEGIIIADERLSRGTVTIALNVSEDVLKAIDSTEVKDA